MWRCWILVNLLALSYTSTQPISDHDGRQECCPCPKPADTAPLATFTRSSFADDCPCRASVHISNLEGGFPRFGNADQALAGSAGDGTFVRAGGVDDCPCRFRDADSVGAPSVFFPSAVRALWPGVSDKEAKDDVKPLLHPEVGLASSVLETLREATDEEYQEALARDAARSVLEAQDIEAMSDVSSALDTARNIVNVLLNPSDMENDDSNSEASHVQESRCIHPLGRSKGLSKLKVSPSVSDVYTKKRPDQFFKQNIWDMDNSVEASNVNEKIIDGIGRNFDKSKLNGNPSSINLFDSTSTDEAIKTKFKPLKNHKNIFTKEADKPRSHLDEINMNINNSLADLKLKLDNHLQSIKINNADKLKNVLDNIGSPSVPNLVLKSILPTNKLDVTTINPYPLKSLFKLKDVELIPPVRTSSSDFNKARVNTPNLIPSSNHNNKESPPDLFKNFKSTDLGDLISNGLKISFKNINNQRGTENIQPIPKGIFKSGIVDAETSPSEIKTTINKEARSNRDCNDDINEESLQNEVQLPKVKNTEFLEDVPIPIDTEKENFDDSPSIADECQTELENNNINDLSNTENKIPKTEIIDTVPSASHIQPIELTNDHKDSEQENFNDASRDEVDCETVISNEGNESEIRDFEESNRDDVHDADLENDETNFEEDKGTEAKESKENCNRESLNQQDSVPAARSDFSSEVETNIEQISDLNSATNHESFSEDCVQEKGNKLVKITNPLFNKGTLITTIKKNKLKDPVNKEKYISESLECQQEDEIPFKTVQNTDLEKTPFKALETQDLQNMSDKLLDLSTQRDQESNASENKVCKNFDESQEITIKVPNAMKFDANRLEDDITKKKSVTKSEDGDNSAEIGKFTDIADFDDKRKLSCASEFERKPNAEFQSNTKHEMTADGSDPYVDKVAPGDLNKPSLLYNILHPNIQNIGHKLGGPNLNKNDKLNLNFPNLFDVRENLADIFQPKDNLGFFNIKEERINDDSNTMSVDASAPTFKSALPTFQPWEDIDLDIFQLRPLSLPGPHELLSKLPSLPPLNFNSYKAKVAVPKGFNLKPMKLESSLGGKNGILGATLTIGSNKKSKLFNNPLALNNIPTLEEFHSNLRENAQNLLLTPIDITGRNMIDDSLRSSQTLTDNIRSHAKTTVKDIQQTLETTLRDIKQSDLGILADPIKDPKEFLQAVSRTHEDVTDKLKAIQYDLNDRLESIRDRFTDQSLLPTLNAPMRQSSSILRSDKIKEKPLFSASYRKSSKSKPLNNPRANATRKKTVKTKNMKLSSAPSIPVPKTVEAPRLRAVASSSPAPFLLKHPSLRIPQLLTNKKSFTDMLQLPVSQFRDSKIPVLGKIKPVNKVKISFGSTTLKPDISRNKPSLASRPSVPRKPTPSFKLTSSSKGGAPRIGSKLKPFDSNGATSNLAPAKLKAPATNEEIENERPVIKTLTVSKPKSLLNKSKPNNDGNKFTNGHSGMQFPTFDQSPLKSRDVSNSARLGSPNNIDILSSLREAVRARLSNLTPLTNDKIVQPNTSNSDMLRSASENVESSNANGLMKENASYTCKMMCTRNS